MNTFKRKSLHAAVLAGLGVVGMAGTASAIPSGEVLIYPYYTAPAHKNDPHYPAPAIVVAGQEDERSAPVLDFNCSLTPRDVWTDAIVYTRAPANTA